MCHPKVRPLTLGSNPTQTGSIGASPGFIRGREGRLGVLSLAAPEFGISGYAYIIQALQQFEKDRDVYAVLLADIGCAAAPVGDLRSRQAASWRIDRYPKPVIALVDGGAAGPALGLALHGTHCVASEMAAFCVSQVATGDPPSAGLSLRLPRLPGNLGLFLALSGRSIGRAAAFRAGLVTHCIDAKYYPQIRERLAQADPVDDILDGLHQDPGDSPLDPHLPTIEACFAAPSPEDIVARLHTVAGPEAAWAQALAHEISGFSAAALDATYRMLTGDPPQDLRCALALEYRVAMARRGVPAAVLDLPPEPHAPSIS